MRGLSHYTIVYIIVSETAPLRMDSLYGFLDTRRGKNIMLKQSKRRSKLPAFWSYYKIRTFVRNILQFLY